VRLARQDVSTATGTLGKALLSKAGFKDQQVDSDDSDYEDTKKALKDSLMDAKLDKAQCSTALKHATQKLEELKKKAQELHEVAVCKERKVAQGTTLESARYDLLQMQRRRHQTWRTMICWEEDRRCLRIQTEM